MPCIAFSVCFVNCFLSRLEFYCLLVVNNNCFITRSEPQQSQQTKLESLQFLFQSTIKKGAHSMVFWTIVIKYCCDTNFLQKEIPKKKFLTLS